MTVSLLLLPRLMFATAGLIAFCVTQLTPAATCADVPEPPSFSTRTATSFTSLATPNVVPPTVPATCVPWPWPSSAGVPTLTASKPSVTRPPSAGWSRSMPVSMMYACTLLAVVEYE